MDVQVKGDEYIISLSHNDQMLDEIGQRTVKAFINAWMG